MLRFLLVGAIGTAFSCQQPASTSSVTPAQLIGKTIEVNYGEDVFHVTFDSDSVLRWTAEAGAEKGAAETETYKAELVNVNQVFITWGEANGIGVSQILDFDKGLVYNHLLRGREVRIGQGKIRIL
ncbi:MAG: MoaF N-terminal domain-containing protein [Cyclobacteriaceae bacterium]|nr:MoaF N-terminal domain-containing protein [Cyclobacteriaceae bacterium]